MNEVSKENKDRALQVIADCIEKARKYYDVKIPGVAVSYRLKGVCAGKMYSTGQMKLNPVLFSENVETFLARTVPHETAHHIVNALREETGTRSRKGVWSAHGRKWQEVMRLIGAEVTRCHSYDVSRSRARKVERNHKFSCGCTEHNFTAIRANRDTEYRAKTGRAFYRCRSCKQGCNPV